MASFELSSPFFRGFFFVDGGTVIVNWEVEDNRLSSCSRARTASAAAFSERLSNDRLDSAWTLVSLERACDKICIRPVLRIRRVWFKEVCAVLSPTAKRFPSRARLRSYSALISLGRSCSEAWSCHSSSVSLSGLFLLFLALCFAFIRLKMSMPLAKAETMDDTTAVTSTEDILNCRG